MTAASARKKVLLVGATGLCGRAVHTLFATRAEVITAGIDNADLFLDLSDPESMTRALASIGGGLSAVLCAAGQGHFAPLETLRPASLAESPLGLAVENKLMGQVNLALASMEHLVDGGVITLVTGIASEQPIRGGIGFTMVNGAIEAFTRAIAIEMPRGLRINVVSPGVLSESPAHVFDLFAGFEPVPASRVAQAYLRSVEGLETGKVFKVW